MKDSPEIHALQSINLSPCSQFGERVVESTVGSGDAAQLTVTDYYADTAETGRYSRAKSVVNPDGSWAFYDYDAQGRKTQEVASCGNSGMNNLADGKITAYGYAVNDPRDATALWGYEPRQTSVTVGGVVVSKSFYTSYQDDNGDTVEIKELCVIPSSAYGDTNSQREVVVHYGAANTNEALRGQTKSHLKPDGSLTTYNYEYGIYSPGNSEPGEFLPDPSGEAMQITTVHGTALHPEGVPFLSTREISVKDEYSNEVLNERDVFVGEGTYQRIAWSAKSYDFYGHLTDEWKSAGLHASTAWGGGCCGKDSDMTETGIETVYSYDPLSRLISKIRIGTNGFTDGVTTTYILDAAGKGLSETVSAGGLSQTTSNVYDSAGRLVWTMDAAGIVTEYLDNGLTRTTIRGGLTNITANYLDGRVQSASENGVLKSFQTYGVNPDGTRWTTTYTGPAGTNSPVWQKTTTDLLGRTVKEEKPGIGGSLLTTIYSYNTKGQLISTTQQPNNSTTLSEYNELGEQTRSGLDVNTNGVLDLAGPDRVNESTFWYVQDASNDWWQVRASIVYAGNNSAVPTTNSIQKTRLSGFSQISNLMSEMVSTDINGNSTTSRTYVDRNNKTVTQVAIYPDSTNAATQITINGLLTSSTSKTGVQTAYTYDALGRQIASMNPEPRTLGSFTSYNSRGQVTSTMDAASNGNKVTGY
jgi:YD repeat-containing protein